MSDLVASEPSNGAHGGSEGERGGAAGQDGVVVGGGRGVWTRGSPQRKGAGVGSPDTFSDRYLLSRLRVGKNDSH